MKKIIVAFIVFGAAYASERSNLLRRFETSWSAIEKLPDISSITLIENFLNQPDFAQTLQSTQDTSEARFLDEIQAKVMKLYQKHYDDVSMERLANVFAQKFPRAYLRMVNQLKSQSPFSRGVRLNLNASTAYLYMTEADFKKSVSNLIERYKAAKAQESQDNMNKVVDALLSTFALAQRAGKDAVAKLNSAITDFMSSSVELRGIIIGMAKSEPALEDLAKVAQKIQYQRSLENALKRGTDSQNVVESLLKSAYATEGASEAFNDAVLSLIKTGKYPVLFATINSITLADPKVRADLSNLKFYMKNEILALKGTVSGPQSKALALDLKKSIFESGFDRVKVITALENAYYTFPEDQVDSQLQALLQDEGQLKVFLESGALSDIALSDPLLKAHLTTVLSTVFADKIAQFGSPLDAQGKITQEYTQMGQLLENYAVESFPEVFVRSTALLDAQAFQKSGGRLAAVNLMNKQVQELLQPDEEIFRRPIKSWFKAQVRSISVRQTMRNTLNRVKAFFSGKTILQQASDVVSARTESLGAEIAIIDASKAPSLSVAIEAMVNTALRPLMDDVVGLLSNVSVKGLSDVSAMTQLMEQLKNLPGQALKSSGLGDSMKDPASIKMIATLQMTIQDKFFEEVQKRLTGPQKVALTSALSKTITQDAKGIILSNGVSDLLQLLVSDNIHVPVANNPSSKSTVENSDGNVSRNTGTKSDSKNTGLTEEERQQEQTQEEQEKESGNGGEQSGENDGDPEESR